MSELVSASGLHNHVADLLPQTDSDLVWKASVSSGERLKKQGLSASVSANSAGKYNGVVTTEKFKQFNLWAQASVGPKFPYVNPTITYEQAPHSIAVEAVGDQPCTPQAASIKYAYTIKCLTAAVSTQPFDGFPSKVDFSTRVTKDTYAAVTFEYDPFRSGLKSFSYGLYANRPSWFPNGGLSYSCTSPATQKIGLNYFVNKNHCQALLLADSAGSVIVGGAYSSPCGAALSVTANIFQKSIGLFTRKRIRGEVTVSFSGSVTSTLKPAFGVSLEL